jgi:hypothetical protein
MNTLLAIVYFILVVLAIWLGIVMVTIIAHFAWQLLKYLIRAEYLVLALALLVTSPAPAQEHCDDIAMLAIGWEPVPEARIALTIYYDEQGITSRKSGGWEYQKRECDGTWWYRKINVSQQAHQH